MRLNKWTVYTTVQYSPYKRLMYMGTYGMPSPHGRKFYSFEFKEYRYFSYRESVFEYREIKKIQKIEFKELREGITYTILVPYQKTEEGIYLGGYEFFFLDKRKKGKIDQGCIDRILFFETAQDWPEEYR